MPPEATETDAEKVKVTYDPKQLFYQSHTRGWGGGGQGDELFGEQNALKKSPLFAFYFIREGQHYIAVFLP